MSTMIGFTACGNIICLLVREDLDHAVCNFGNSSCLPKVNCEVITVSDKHYMHHNKRNQLINDIKKLSQFQEKITLQKKTSNLFRHRPQKIHKIDVRAF